MPTLTNLPTELLQLIAGRCSAPDILALSLTCRHLNKACDGAAVFQMSFESHLPEIASPAFKDGSALVRFMRSYIDGPKKPCQRNEGPKMAWLCLAVAISRLPDASSELEQILSHMKSSNYLRLESLQLDDDTKVSLRGLIAFLATLPIWGCMSIDAAANGSPSVPALLDELCPVFFSQMSSMKPLRIDQSLGGEHPLQFAFCLAMSNLEVWQLYTVHKQTVEDPGSTFIPATNILLSVVKGNYEGTTLGSEYNEFQGSWIGKQTHALLLIALVARNIYYLSKGAKPSLFVRFLNLGLINRDTTVETHLPNPKKVKFLSPWYFAANKEKGEKDSAYGTWIGDTLFRPRFPLVAPNLVAVQGKRGRHFYPFAGDEWWSWYTTRVRDLAKRLDEGEWCGTYTYKLHLGGRVDPPMERIRFRKTSTDGDSYSVEALDAIDGIGTFTLRGEVNASDVACTVHLRKQYSTHQFDWEGLVTPLGICGGYYSAGHRASRPLGYFWLWKREWVNDADE
ncbi:hypothetical protein F4677DRAFT_442631 [Hypoxylon crocopeplum]|nr:hypothetical protein F4677DRAFT_442631 [Hypoxylon crocopeplum]